MQGAMSICFPRLYYSGSTIPWSPYEYSNYTGNDIEFEDNLNQIGGCIPPYSTHLNRYPNCL